MLHRSIAVLLTGAMCLLGTTLAWAVKYNEAPMLRVKVAAGELPPVEKRLPEEPLVVKPVEKIGQYGGTLRVVGVNDYEVETLLNLGLYALAQDFQAGTHEYYKGVAESKIVPHFAKGGEFSKDKKTFTLYLRKGVKWSDGVPLTADDLLFWWEDIINNKELTPVIDPVLKPGGKLMEVEKVNDYTVRFHFSVPYKFFTYYLCDWALRNRLIRPRHYLKQFHIKYNPKADELAKKEGFDHWWNLFADKCDYRHNPDLPTYFPWKTVEYKPERWVGERNPYFWKVDTAGNQLPYIDKIICEFSTNREVLNMKVIAGQADYADIALPFTDIPLFKANEKKGGYRCLLWDTPMGAMPSIIINQTYKKDPVLGKIFRDKRFRQALSLAINRKEANKVAYFGLSQPKQATVLPGSKFGEPEFYTAYAEYSPEKANQLLDEMGLKWDKDHKWRLRPDGKTLTVVIEDIDVGAVRGYSKIRPLLKEYWEKVGVKTVLKTIDPGLFGTRREANQLQITLWGLDNFSDLAIQIMGPWLIPGTSYGGNWYAPLWDQWVKSGGKSGEEPPEELKRMRQIWLEMRDSENEQEIVRLGKEIFRMQAENLYYIGVVGSVKQAIVAKNNLRNVPEEAVWANDVSLTQYGWPSQWFFEK